MSKHTNSKELLAFANELAKNAGELLVTLKKQNPTPNIYEKNKTDFFTDCDLAVESSLISLINKRYPYHSIFSEENGLSDNKDTNYRWIIDPIDGTHNFIHGLTDYSISIALKIDEIIEIGIIYLPELEKLYVAQRGQGAYLNGEKITVSQCHQLNKALCGATIPPKYYLNQDLSSYLQQLQNLRQNLSGYRYSGSFAYDMARVAEGKLDACWSPYSQPWDIAAGICLVKEAGGVVTDFKKTTQLIKNNSVIAGNAQLLAMLYPFIE